MKTAAVSSECAPGPLDLRIAAAVRRQTWRVRAGNYQLHPYWNLLIDQLWVR